MNAVVQKWGNSLALRIPKAVADQIQVAAGSEIELKVEGASLVVTAAAPRYRLSDLLKQVTPDNRPGEIDWGPPKGKEAW
jgi:antitoxin MazE